MSKTKLTQMIEEQTNAPVIPNHPLKAKVINPLSDGNQHLREVPEGEVEEITRTPGTKKYGITNHRLVEIGERRFRLNCHDPYGFWYIVPQTGGVLPDKLKGSFTSVLEAEKALTVYINNLNKKKL